jgi:hypothetical protein
MEYLDACGISSLSNRDALAGNEGSIVGIGGCIVGIEQISSPATENLNNDFL